ncbi:uncharacterized protein EURHEDRAFT_219384 [Aspergillus ruber CBS 135680]|uniref:Ankyrin repeat-containing domain protein n=1 Tax=Aspergillus ruber (strain CBS 135680) TaxID=1388766 RepID=A0A017SNV6_ASPRC|nr:uncharacterized protein EURHEDRAFT_219384 [Aspergillus ruber CBS 135680]EYE98648.1 hypothetical protein EURHEDRAFT_219384 [Aspergillus ruber CBS 135680]
MVFIKQGQNALVKQLLPPSRTPLPDIVSLLKASIETKKKKKKNIDTLRYLLDNFKPDSEEYLFRYVVIEPLNYDRTEEFKLLSECNPEILTQDISHTGNALANAIWGNNIILASFLLTHGNDPNECQFMSRPPIVSATYLRHHETINLSFSMELELMARMHCLWLWKVVVWTRFAFAASCCPNKKLITGSCLY